MKTLSIAEGRQNLGTWLKRALHGEDVGFVVDGRVVALRPVEVHSDDFALQEYGMDDRQMERAYRTVKTNVRKAQTSSKTETLSD